MKIKKKWIKPPIGAQGVGFEDGVCPLPINAKLLEMYLVEKKYKVMCQRSEQKNLAAPLFRRPLSFWVDKNSGEWLKQIWTTVGYNMKHNKPIVNNCASNKNAKKQPTKKHFDHHIVSKNV